MLCTVYRICLLLETFAFDASDNSVVIDEIVKVQCIGVASAHSDLGSQAGEPEGQG